jgi:predicted PurR-regulated permease PerM
MAALMAVLAALLLLIPWLGIVLAIIPAFLLGLSNGLMGGVIAAVFTAAILLIIDVVIMPRLFTHQRASSLLLVILIVALANTYGFIGAILAPPLAVSVQILLGRLFQNYVPVTNGETESEISSLQQRLSAIKTSLSDLPEPHPSEVVSLADRVEQLIGKTHEYMRTYKHS